MSEAIAAHVPVIVVGGGQAGLSTSYWLKQRGIEHLVFEKNYACHVWETARWDTFCLVTPNWQCDLPGHPYDGPDPNGFMKKDEIVAYVREFARKVAPPIREGVTVMRAARRPEGGFAVTTTDGLYSCDEIVVASGGYVDPVIPRMAEKLPASVMQIQSEAYRNPAQLPEGAVLVVGSGQSGAQIAEDLHLAGRKVHLAVGPAPRCARFYRGRDVVAWLADMDYYKITVETHPLLEGVRDNTNHYVTGRDGGRDIDLRRFAKEGMELYGALDDFVDGALTFRLGLKASLDAADRTYNSINAAIDKHIVETGVEAPPPSVYEPIWEPGEEPLSLDLAASGITSVVWCIGFTPNFRWLDAPVFNGAGRPVHKRGLTGVPGVSFIGLPWLNTWGSGRFGAVGQDAAHIVEAIVARLVAKETLQAAE